MKKVKDIPKKTKFAHKESDNNIYNSRFNNYINEIKEIFSNIEISLKGQNIYANQRIEAYSKNTELIKSFFKSLMINEEDIQLKKDVIIYWNKKAFNYLSGEEKLPFLINFLVNHMYYVIFNEDNENRDDILEYMAEYYVKENKHIKLEVNEKDESYAMGIFQEKVNNYIKREDTDLKNTNNKKIIFISIAINVLLLIIGIIIGGLIFSRDVVNNSIDIENPTEVITQPHTEVTSEDNGTENSNSEKNPSEKSTDNSQPQ